MDMTDWDIDRTRGVGEFTFYEDGYDLFVAVYFEVYAGELDWGLDEHYIINPNGLPASDNADMANFFYGEYVQRQIEDKLIEELL